MYDINTRYLPGLKEAQIHCELCEQPGEEEADLMTVSFNFVSRIKVVCQNVSKRIYIYMNNNIFY